MLTISNVIGWKFNDQPGMICKEDKDGVLQIIKFPGGIPTQADQDTWTQEYTDWITAGGDVTAEATRELGKHKLIKLIALVFFNHENRIRVLEGKVEIDLPTFKQSLIDRY